MAGDLNLAAREDDMTAATHSELLECPVAGTTNPIADPGDDLAVVLTRIRGEYLEMPGLRLTERQAERLWNLDEATCRLAFGVLIRAGFLTRSPSGVVALARIRQRAWSGPDAPTGR
jgi:hypothetical protein